MRLKKVVDDAGRERVVRANRYNFRPHDRSRAQLRRLRQMVKGQLSVDAETLREAQDLILQVSFTEAERDKQIARTA